MAIAMAVSDNPTRNVYTATPGARVFPYSFKIASKEDLLVIVNGIRRYVDVDFTVSGVGHDAGGNVTFGYPIVGPERVIIMRNMRYRRTRDYQNLGDLRSYTLNNDQDEPVMMIQQLAELQSRSLQLAVDYDGPTPLTIPSPEAGKVLGWNMSGKSLINYKLTGAGDLTLRTNLADPSGGANLVAYGPGVTVKQKIDSLSLATSYMPPGNGAVLRTLASKAGDFVTSADYGAVSNASIDTSSHLQRAINAARGGVLTILPGAYLLGTALKIPSNTTVNAYGATFFRIGALNNMLINDADGVTGGWSANANIRICGGTWDSFYGPGGATGVCTVIAFGHAKNITVEDVTVINENEWHHLELNGVANASITRCTFIGGGTVPTGSNECVQFDSADNPGEFPWFGPYDGTVCNSVHVRGCTFDSNGCGVGCHSEPTTQNHQGIFILDNTFRNQYHSAIKSQYMSGVKISDNRIDTCGYGIYVNQNVGLLSNDITIDGNTIYRAGYSGSWLDCRAIYLRGDSAQQVINARVVNNYIYDVGGAGTHGIACDFSKRVVIMGNTIERTNRSGIFIFGGVEKVNIIGNTVISENVAGAGYESIRVAGLSGALATRVTCTGNNCTTMGITSANRSLVTGNNVSESISSYGNTLTPISSNLIGTTWG